MLNSPLHSYLLAETFGLYFVIMSIVLLSRENYYRKLMLQEPNYPSLLSCSLSLFVSIFLVLIHNIWILQPRVVVTIVCWCFLLRSILMIACPEHVFQWTRKVCMGKFYYVVLLIMAILGVALLMRGSFLFISLMRVG